MHKLRSDGGFSLVEIMMAMAVSMIVIAAVVAAYTGSLKIFMDVKGISETMDTKTPAVEIIGRYFDRWGAGVPDNSTATSCALAAYPNVRAKCMSYTAGSPCDNVSFFSNVYGLGFVRAVNAGTATLTSCRLSTGSNQNCYNLWRNNAIQNTVTLSLDNLSSSTGNCLPYSATSNTSGIDNANTSNATASTIPLDASTNNAVPASTFTPGDIIQRSPHLITLYCAANASDGNNRWLYAKLNEMPSVSGSCNSDPNAAPIAPVNSFSVTPLPSGCNAAAGACSAVSITVSFRAQSRKYAGQYDNYTVTRIYGR